MALSKRNPAAGCGARDIVCLAANSPENNRIDRPPQAQFGLILGIDIGVTGGIAVISPAGELIDVHPMPCLAEVTQGAAR
jgi:predicted RNase H-like nuclease (RuvC/YqgF family)